MGRLLLWMSLTVCAFAVFFSFDSFSPYRSQLVQNIPDSVNSVLNSARQFFSELLARIADYFVKPDILLTKEKLSKYTGQTGDAVYLAILGHVYDVTRGKKHYGPGGGYSFFSGRDGSSAFVSGDFTEQGLTDDVSGFTSADALALREWETFYRKDYTYVGKLVGNFYDVEGKPTAALAQYKETLQKALAEKKAEDDLRLIFPSCNSQWSQGGHGRVWCTTRSGGIQRDWVGVPRQFYEPGKAQDKPRCVCSRNTGPPSDSPHSESHKNRGDVDNPNLKVYDGCEVNADSCTYMRSGD